MSDITMRDISQKSGVSMATVSRVLNKKKNVSSNAVEKVMEAVNILGYQPSQKKKTGPRETNNLIGVIVPRLRNPFYNDILDGIQDVAVRNGYSVIIAQSRSDFDMDVMPPPFLRHGLIDGLITMDHLGHMKALLANVDESLPIVQCCEYDERMPYPYVAIDDYAAAYNAVSYLKSIGRVRLALFNSTCKSLYGSRREAGFRDALSALGLPVYEPWICHLNVIDYNIAFSAACETFRAANAPDAVFAISDVYAAAVARAIRRCGLDVPRDVAVIGFDNTEISLMSDPPLTTVNQPRYDIGSMACTALMRMIHGQPSLTQKMLIDSELIVRGST